MTFDPRAVAQTLGGNVTSARRDAPVRPQAGKQSGRKSRSFSRPTRRNPGAPRPTVDHALARKNHPMIRAELFDADCCTALGLEARGAAPVLALSRKLLAAGHHPALALEAYRGETLCLRIRSIGEAAGLTVEDSRHGPRASAAGTVPVQA